jgi:Family of unknown function (DUF6677)
MNQTRVTTADEARAMDKGKLLVLCLVAWAIPGAGHLWQRQTLKGLVFLAVLPLMFALGLLFDGTLFGFAPTAQSVLTTGAALAERGVGLPWLVASFLGAGAGNIVSPTYEYGWVFMVVSGLLNCLVILDARDIALGRR